MNTHESFNFSAGKFFVTFIFGFLLGLAAGLIGVGGGEFRIPVLLYVIGLPLIEAIAVNLLIGLLTVAVSFFIRFKLGLMNENAINILIAMSFGSIFGSYFGAALTGRIKVRLLKRILAVLLVLIGLKILLEPFIQISPWQEFSFSASEETFLALFVGAIIGVISGIFGVAGGEFRIPALIYLFGLNIKNAGTMSQLVSIPTVATGFLKHHRMGHTSRSTIIISVLMSIGSGLGAIIGASLAAVVEADILKIFLGVILISSAVKTLTKP